MMTWRYARWNNIEYLLGRAYVRYESIQIDMPIDVMRGIVASKGHVSFTFITDKTIEIQIGIMDSLTLLFFIVTDGPREIDYAQERRPFLIE